MKNLQTGFLFLFVFLGFYNFGYGQCAQTSDIYSFGVGAKNYELVKVKKTFASAAACAIERSGYLVHIGDSAEQAGVYAGILASGVLPNYSPVMDGGGISYVWIGGTDAHTEDKWVWDGKFKANGSGENFWNGQGKAGTGVGSPYGNSFVNWGGKSVGLFQEPDEYAGQDAAAIALAGWPNGSTLLGVAGEWNDIDADNAIYFVVEKGVPSGLGSEHKRMEWRTFPNPVQDRLTLSLSNESEEAELVLMDQNGQVIFSMLSLTHGESEIDLSHLPSGFYVLKIQAGEQIAYSKIIKI